MRKVKGCFLTETSLNPELGMNLSEELPTPQADMTTLPCLIHGPTPELLSCNHGTAFKQVTGCPPLL